MQQGAAVKDRLGEGAPEIPELRACCKNLAGTYRTRADISGQRDIRQAVGHRHTDLCAGRVEILLRLAHVRALFNELRGKGQRELPWQLHLGELETLRDLLIRKRSGQCGEDVTLLAELPQ